MFNELHELLFIIYNPFNGNMNLTYLEVAQNLFI